VQGSDAAFAVTASYKKESPMDELLNGKSIKADFEAQVYRLDRGSTRLPHASDTDRSKP
jgi:hypothetical protein